MQVFIISALSADGFIAKSDQEPSTRWTSSEDTKFFQEKTKQAGVVVYGSKTFDTIPYKYKPLKERLNVIYTNSPDKYEDYNQNELITTSDEPKTLIEKLKTLGHESIAICGGTSIYSLFISSGLVTKLFLTIEPVLFGSGTTLFDSQIDKKLKLVKVHNLSDQSIVLEYDLK
ncbi:dihydrofolate reductase family protein [Patescibacteria group bacterium]